MRHMVNRFTKVEIYDIIIFVFICCFVYFFVKWQQTGKARVFSSEPKLGVSDQVMLIELFPDVSTNNGFDKSQPTSDSLADNLTH